MKKSIALGFALSVFAAGSAIASPSTSAHQAVVLEPTYIHATALDSKAAEHTTVAKVFDSHANAAVIVADNRKEFGSQFQRY